MRYYALAEEARFYSNGGPCQRLLTDRLQQYLGGATHVVPVSNATVGLMAAVRGACGMRTDSRPVILTPAYTFTATAAAIEWAGFEPVFVDIERRGWHLDPASLEAAF
jgi:dTDP-4-amino-4,6-dideoxygalactose transaminase